jgi:C1A family cysteine protease
MAYRTVVSLVTLCLMFGFHLKSSASDSLTAINEAISSVNANWIAKENWVTQLSDKEFKTLLGHTFDEQNTKKNNQEFLNPPYQGMKNMPSAFDWRNYNGHNWITPVKNQGTCGSCTAFASIGALEAIYRSANQDPGLNIDLSEQHLFTCVGGTCAGTTGISIDEALSYILYSGIPDEACYPYQGIDTDCASTCPDWESRAVTISGFQRVSPSNQINPDLLKPAVAIQPIVCSMLVYDDFRYYETGVYQHVSGGYMGGHAVVIVGWDDAGSCWICKNSWGTDWGEDGFFRIRWEDCYIGGESTYIYYNLPFPKPTLTVTLAMPSHTFEPGMTCACDVSIHHAANYALGRCPLFVALEISGYWFFAPGFSNTPDYFLEIFPPGTSNIAVLPNFTWPAGAGSGTAAFYSVALDPKIEQLISNLEVYDFEWME